MLADHFAPNAPIPAVGPPMFLPFEGVAFHHARIAAHKFIERIINPGARSLSNY
jgi:hypothetical protein